MKTLLLVPILLMAFSVVGCSTNDNPVTPEKMQAIRKSQQEQMAQLAKSGGAPPASPQGQPK